MKDWLLQRGARISCTKFFANEALPEIESIDLLIVMGVNQHLR